MPRLYLIEISSIISHLTLALVRKQMHTLMLPLRQPIELPHNVIPTFPADIARGSASASQLDYTPFGKEPHFSSVLIWTSEGQQQRL
jgi:hypothetical protein